MAFLLVAVAVVFLGSLCIGIYYKTFAQDIFQRLGIDSPPASFVFGHLVHAVKNGFFESQIQFYEMFKDQKVYGIYDFRAPALYVRDLDMIKDIFIRNFNQFTNRRALVEFDDPFHDSLLTLNDERWRHVRSTVAPTFSSSRLKKMTRHIERSAQQLASNLYEKHVNNPDVDLREISSFFATDVIASTAFGIDMNSMKNPGNPFIVNVQNALKSNVLPILLAIFFPSFAKFFSFLGLRPFNRKALLYLTKVVDSIMLSRQSAGEAGKVNDFLDLLINAEASEGKAAKGLLTKSEIDGVALNFIFAGFHTVSNSLGFALFLLTNNPRCLQLAQAEIDSEIGRNPPDYDNVQGLTYLDMCINETLRMYPGGGSFIDRVCGEDVTIHGIHIPKGLTVVLPIYAIHHDPEIWVDPYEFKPERFGSEQKGSRHQFAYFPFGHGPRMCLGMRLGLIELKIAIATILQKFTPVPCERTVYPIVLTKSLLFEARDGLWVKLELRKQK